MQLSGKQLLSIIIGCIGPCVSMAQYTFTVRITELPATHAGDSIYLTGNFNSWNPAQEQMLLTKQPDGSFGVSVLLEDVPSDRLEFKFTRGSWQTSECTTEGRLIGPRLGQLNRDTTITCQIDGWRDDFPVSTASANVHLLDSAFYIPQLDRYRKIWIYLPADYASSGKRYPVLYMHDGQHLFDEATSQGRYGPIEWGVDETLDTAAEKCIVVAINHQADYADRVPEFLLRSNSEHPNVEGPQYLAFIAQTLKPYIDTHYRTLPDKAHTGLAGSSLGGLITLYGGLTYPDVFGALGVFSPSIWMDADNVMRELTSPANKTAIKHQRYYFYAGTSEVRRKPDGTFVDMNADAQAAMALLQQEAGPQTELAIRKHGRHGALDWREAFPAFFDWFMAGIPQHID